MKFQKYRIYLVGALIFSLGILVGYLLNPEKYQEKSAKEWHGRYREIALSRAQIVDCVRNSYLESTSAQTLEKAKKCTYLIDLVPVDLNTLQ